MRSSEPRYEEYPPTSKDEFYESRGSERYKDADSQSGDRDSLRSYHSDSKRDKYEKYPEDNKPPKDKLVEDKKKDKIRVAAAAYSPPSDYEGYKTVRRSVSHSPPRGRKSSKDTRNRSPVSPIRKSSPEASPPRKVIKTKMEGPGYTPSTTLISEIQKTRPRKQKRESESDMSELDRALLKTDLFESPPKRKRQDIEDHLERARREAEANIEYRQKIESEREQSFRRSLSGSHSLDYASTSTDSYRDVAAKGNSLNVQVPRPGYGEEEIESKFSTPSPSTKSTKSESDKTPDSSERNSGSNSSGDNMDLLVKEKQRLLSELQDMEDNGSVSDGEIRDEEDVKVKEKKPKLEEVFDFELSPSECSMKKWREKAKKLEREQAGDGQENKEPHPKNAHTEPPPKPPEPPGTGDSKLKNIDAKKSFRKQMEAMRKEHDKDTTNSTSQGPKNGEGPRGSCTVAQGPNTELDESTMDISESNDASPSEFRKKKSNGNNSNDFPKVKGQRSYRTTRTDEMAFGLSSGDEHDASLRAKHDESASMDNHSKARKQSDLDKIGKSPSVNRRESTDSKHSSTHDLERENSLSSRRGSKDSRESGASRRDSSHSKRDKSSDSSRKRDLRIEPCIIPEFIIETKTKDGKFEKRVLHDPRKKPEKTACTPGSFPLPKFAAKFLRKGTSPKQASRHRSSPKGPIDPLLASSKLRSPLFSPDLSPATSKLKFTLPTDKATPEKAVEKQVDTTSDSDRKEPVQMDKERKDESHIFDDIKTAILDNIKFDKKVDNKAPLTTDTSSGAVESCEKVDKEQLHEDNNMQIDTIETGNVTTEACITKSEVKFETNEDTGNLVSSKNELSSENQNSDNNIERKDEPMDTNETVKRQCDNVPNTAKKSEDIDNCSKDLSLDIKQSTSLSDTVNDNVAQSTVKAENLPDKDTSDGKDNKEVVDNKKDEPIPNKSETNISPTKDKHTSDSDLSDLDNSGMQSLDEQIRALDEKIEQASSVNVRRTPTDSPSTPSTPTATPTAYRERFKVRKRGDSSGALSINVGGATPSSDSKGEPSDYVKSLLSRSSIFDQDSKRLEQIDEKYQPKEYNLNLDRPTSVGANEDAEEEEFESKVKDYYGLSHPKVPSFPSSILRPQLSSGADGDPTNAEQDGYGLGPSLTLAPPGSLSNQDIANKFGPQALSRYPFLAKKNSPPQPGTPVAGTSESLRSPPLLPRDPRRDPLSPPLVMPPSILKKSPVTTPVSSSPGGSLVSPLAGLSSPPGILKKTEPGPSILKKNVDTTTTSALNKTSSAESLSDTSRDSSRFVQGVKTEDVPDQSIRSETKETKRSSAEGLQPTVEKPSPSGTGSTAISSQPENSAVQKNELSSGDGVQYQSTPSPPVLIKESKATQGIGTKSTVKRTASEAFNEKQEKDNEDGTSPPHLTESVALFNANKSEDCEKHNITSKKNEPDCKKAKIVSEKDKKEQPLNSGILKSCLKDTKKVSSSHCKSLPKETGKTSDTTEKETDRAEQKSDKKSLEKVSSSSKVSMVEKSNDKLNVIADKSGVKPEKVTDKRNSTGQIGKSSSGLDRNSHSKAKISSSDKKLVEKSKSTESMHGRDKKLSDNDKKTEKKTTSSDHKVSSGDKKTDKSSSSSLEKKIAENKHSISEKKTDKHDSDKKSSSSNEKRPDKNKKIPESKSKDNTKSTEKSHHHHSSTSSWTSTKSSSSQSSVGAKSNDVRKDKSGDSKKDIKKETKPSSDIGKVKKGDDFSSKGEKKSSSSGIDRLKSKGSEQSSKNVSKSGVDSKSMEPKVVSSKESTSGSKLDKLKSEGKQDKLKSPDKGMRVDDKKIDLNKHDKHHSKENNRMTKSSKYGEKEKTERHEKSISKGEKIDGKIDKSGHRNINEKYNQKVDKTKNYSNSKNKQPHKKNHENSSKTTEKHNEIKGKSNSELKTKAKNQTEKKLKTDDVKKHSNSTKKDGKNNKIINSVSEKKSPAERKSRSDSITGETRELKQLRTSGLGIEFDANLLTEEHQFFSMYDMVKRRTHKEVSKDDSTKQSNSQFKVWRFSFYF